MSEPTTPPAPKPPEGRAPAIFSGEGTKAVLEVLRDLGRSEPFQEVGGIVTDQFRYWRATRAAKLADKVEEKNRLRRSEGRRTIPLRVVIPAVESAALDERDEMLDLWAELLANFEDPDSGVEVERVFVSLLSEMQPIDVAILRTVASSAGNVGAKAAPQSPLEGISTDRDAILRSLHNLARLGCFMAASDASLYVREDSADSDPDLPTITLAGVRFTLTSLGRALVVACTAPENKQNPQ